MAGNAPRGEMGLANFLKESYLGKGGDATSARRPKATPGSPRASAGPSPGSGAEARERLDQRTARIRVELAVPGAHEHAARVQHEGRGHRRQGREPALRRQGDAEARRQTFE